MNKLNKLEMKQMIIMGTNNYLNQQKGGVQLI